MIDDSVQDASDDGWLLIGSRSWKWKYGLLVIAAAIIMLSLGSWLWWSEPNHGVQSVQTVSEPRGAECSCEVEAAVTAAQATQMPWSGIARDTVTLRVWWRA